MTSKIGEKRKKEVKDEKISSEIVLVCPDCRVQCFDVRTVLKSDGNFWTDDICWRCGAQLPIVRIYHKKITKGGQGHVD